MFFHNYPIYIYILMHSSSRTIDDLMNFQSLKPPFWRPHLSTKQATNAWNLPLCVSKNPRQTEAGVVFKPPKFDLSLHSFTVRMWWYDHISVCLKIRHPPKRQFKLLILVPCFLREQNMAKQCWGDPIYMVCKQEVATTQFRLVVNRLTTLNADPQEKQNCSCRIPG